jgi:AraC-like DNA-binding protein
MQYEMIPPPPLLAPYVRYFWVLEADVPAGTDFVYRSMADGSAELLFHYNGLFDEVKGEGSLEQSFCSGLHGQSRHMRRFIIHKSFGIFGVYLYPFALPLLCSVPADHLSGQMPDLSSLLGKEGTRLEEKMMLAANNKERLKIITAFLLKRLSIAPDLKSNIHEVIRSMIHTQGQIPVQQLAAQSFLSVRQFERKFKAGAGFSPKLYMRILRFQEAIKAYPNRRKSLAEIAYDCGYADQSHFIHDFKEFSGGYHPAAFFKGQNSDVSGIALI